MFVVREEIINVFKKGVFPYLDGFYVEKESDEETDEEQEKTITDIDKFSKCIAEKETDINEKLFKTYFSFQRPSDMLKSL